MADDISNILSELKNIRYWAKEQDRHIAELKKERDAQREEIAALSSENLSLREQAVGLLLSTELRCGCKLHGKITAVDRCTIGDACALSDEVRGFFQ